MSQHIITTAALEEALEVQRVSRAKIGRVLVELGYMSLSECNISLRDYLGVSRVENLVQELGGNLEDVRVECIQVEDSVGYLIEQSTSVTRPALFMRDFNDRVIAKAEEKALAFDMKIVSEEQESILNALCGARLKVTHRSQRADIDSLIQNSEDEGSAPYRNLLKSLLTKAKDSSASDVHFDSGRDGLTVRFRINGDLVEVKRIKKELSQSFMVEVKRQTGLPLTVIGSPCSGAARFSDLKIKVRSQSNGQIHGESIVLRIIDEERIKGASIERVGADDIFLNDLREALKHENGLILMCGQTGSGKSWTLFSVLMSLDRNSMKVITIEDPVEYEGAELMQIEVAPGRIGFGDALKSCMRLDPDVIMIGEIRDEETAQLAFKAASTGHLVLSTLHTNGAIEAIVRLRGLGIDDDLIAANVRLISALSLRKRLCDVCKVSVSHEELGEFSDALVSSVVRGASFFKRNHAGCGEIGCVSGVTGRTLIAESVKQKEVVSYLKGEPMTGYRSIRQGAFELVAKGLIGVEDAVFA